MKNVKLILSVVGGLFVSLGLMYAKGRKDSTQANQNKTMKGLLNQNKVAKAIDDKKLTTKEIKELI